jgi:hypothetical protein
VRGQRLQWKGFSRPNNYKWLLFINQVPIGSRTHSPFEGFQGGSKLGETLGESVNGFFEQNILEDGIKKQTNIFLVFSKDEVSKIRRVFARP